MGNCTIGQAIGTASHSIEWEGRTYAASLLTQARKAEYEDGLVKRSLRLLEAMRAVYSPAEYEDERVALLDAIKVGDFGFHAPLSVGSLQTHAGMLSLAAVLFGIPEDEAIRLLAAKEAETVAVVKAVLVASQPPKAAGDDATGDVEKKAEGPREPFTSRRSRHAS